jgi:hypothetical protein
MSIMTLLHQTVLAPRDGRATTVLYPVELECYYLTINDRGGEP